MICVFIVIAVSAILWPVVIGSSSVSERPISGEHGGIEDMDPCNLQMFVGEVRS